MLPAVNSGGKYVVSPDSPPNRSKPVMSGSASAKPDFGVAESTQSDPVVLPLKSFILDKRL
jgi:hypothetical protein